MTVPALQLELVAPRNPRRSRSALRVSSVLVLLLIFVASAAPLLAPYSPDEPLGLTTLNGHPPSLAFPFGTDSHSRDVLSRVIYGARFSLAIAVTSISLSLVLGTAVGATAAYAGGIVDRILVFVLDVLLSIPRLLIFLAIGALWDSLFTVRALILLLGFTGWYDVARLVRSDTQTVMAKDYVLAARATGVGALRILAKHLLPHLIPILSVSATLGVAHTLVLEAGLSYLGIGVRPPTASWGSIIHDGMGVVAAQWWLTFFPGLAIVITVLACNALGDALRDRTASRS